MPPMPKNVRARTNRSSSAATLSVITDAKIPELLPREVDWHSMTRRWWRELWRSPMSSEYGETDLQQLFQVALLVQDFWTAPDAKSRNEARLRIEKAEADFGLTPLARRRLEWQIEQTEDSKAKGTKRRASATPKPASDSTTGTDDDPRLALVQ